ncbi:MAG: (d)CMP kinase [Candidatus Eremiobacteraeota bacterium]|nr:(d)CMP kinase [Candidatus Eremiobacteraeota bacterium]
MMQNRPARPTWRHVAIDGPVASGKSTVARLLAIDLGATFLDTGALYRAVAYLALCARADPNDDATVLRLLAAHPPAVKAGPQPLQYSIAVDGQTLDRQLFTPSVSRAVSAVAAMPEVRHRLIGVQRAFAAERDVVMAGRDIGSVVLPNADFKFFLTASLDARVQRRLRELVQQGIDIDAAALREEIKGRDDRDAGRALSPLVKAPEALEIDTSAMSVGEVVQTLSAIVRKNSE